jgi:hypothetical protein
MIFYSEGINDKRGLKVPAYLYESSLFLHKSCSR